MSPADRDAARLKAIEFAIRRAYPDFADELVVISNRMIGRLSSIDRPAALMPVSSRRVVHEVQRRDGRTVLVMRRRDRAQFAVGR